MAQIPFQIGLVEFNKVDQIFCSRRKEGKNLRITWNTVPLIQIRWTPIDSDKCCVKRRLSSHKYGEKIQKVQIIHYKISSLKQFIRAYIKVIQNLRAPFTNVNCFKEEIL